VSRAATGRSSGSAGSASIDLRVIVKALQTYFAQSEAPLTTLLFLLPMIVCYEVGTYFFASDWTRHTETRVLAFNLVSQFMQVFGWQGRLFPGCAVVLILVIWHMARRDPWRLDAATAGTMGCECILLAIPLIAISNIIGNYLPLAAVTEAGTGRWHGGIVLALGAGIYEELIFRLFAFTILNILLIDLLRLNRRAGYLLIVVGSAILFSAYHYWSPQSPPFRWTDAVFRTAAGIYFGVLFLARGFGITAGTHAAYDIFFFSLHAMAR
jgi:membrane protease YdiL (CAAX protease family)